MTEEHGKNQSLIEKIKKYTDEARKALAIKDAFIAENPESIEMEDCFDILVKHIEQVAL